MLDELMRKTVLLLDVTRGNPYVAQIAVVHRLGRPAGWVGRVMENGPMENSGTDVSGKHDLRPNIAPYSNRPPSKCANFDDIPVVVPQLRVATFR